MLTSLSVRNLAVVEDLALTFDKGMTSLTGETGAGKSMLVDALSLVLGDRADSNMIRHGAERAEVEADFSLEHNSVLSKWLIEQELDDDEQCHLRRTINRDGRSKGYINGRAVPLVLLREISERSIDIHGQHAHQSLVRPQTQREIIDIVAQNKPLLDELKTVHREWQALQQELETIQQRSDEQKARQELLQYQVDELDALALTEHSINALLQEQTQLANASQLILAAETGLQRIFDDEQAAAYDQISSTLTGLEKLQDFEPRFASAVETLNSAIINLDESATELRHYLDHVELDPNRLDDIETQLSLLHELARKHHVEIEQLPAHYQQLSDELATLSSSEMQQAQRRQAVEEKEKICRALCEKLHQRREKAAKPLAKQITDSIQQLAIPAGRIEIQVQRYSDNRMTETGADQIRLLVATNPGQPAGELVKVASGGELARISLAIQVVTAGKRSVPTLIFDEVDVGIGGSVAEVVGQHLRKLASSQQVICITHLPQVAAQAHHQLQVNKKHLKDSTHIEVDKLDKVQRVEEIARMLGGVNLTQKTRSHAEEMLDQAQQ
ncbi:DNA repair protein RecN [Methylophaga thiooxydans]|uniref:DNA repair protein RecN n=1 Tax=Methylophaga thiooxydans DMS010 TaxID=637616 RepID=C0N2P7_9GAMM|nr:DNA repair protein RecN [Methylophaga thiooxydans]EEF80935.1 DNA repair protein RecN [Methylophaga thiooxydans DMS010]